MAKKSRNVEPEPIPDEVGGPSEASDRDSMIDLSSSPAGGTQEQERICINCKFMSVSIMGPMCLNPRSEHYVARVADHDGCDKFGAKDVSG